MDPFNEVQKDGEEQIKTLNKFLSTVNFANISNDQQLEFENQISELHETIEDLKESIDQIKTEPELYADLSTTEISRREKVIEALQSSYHQINQEWQTKKSKTSTGDNPFLSYEDEVSKTEIQNKVAANRNFQLQQELQYQDQQLDGVYDSVSRINQQARLMGDELEDQAGLISEFEQDMDRAQGRLNKSMKRLNTILEKNREWFSDCCIMLLIAVLVILLLLIVIL
ncbi:Tlg1 protein [Saccharomycopsis crataegensis]|uniref:t-SNARE affecting a late Golgi compartment protein 1 n=1 Tax=Saccharomycopsis crataegensis TaxID=43959 RepID=A0AAV5QV35_9ASCO|nr:Tlg1 protein [Saccharomycopsis crataegensis]